MRHSVPNGDPAAIFDRALTMLLAELEKKKIAQTARPRRVADPKYGSRHVPAAVKRDVWKRDGGRCAFIGTGGRCSERGLLEFHHVVPFADGGETTIVNLQLRCRAHNAYEADVHFGPLLLRETEALYQLGPDRAGSWDQPVPLTGDGLTPCGCPVKRRGHQPRERNARRSTPQGKEGPRKSAPPQQIR